MASWLLSMVVLVLTGGAWPAQPQLVSANNLNAEERRAENFLRTAEEELRASAEKGTFVEWAYASNITDHNEKVKLKFQVSQRLYSWYCWRRRLSPLSAEKG